MKKYLGSVLSVIGYLVYLFVIIAFVMFEPTCSIGVKIFLGAIGLIYIILLVWLLHRRIKEIKGGEVEDAVSKY